MPPTRFFALPPVLLLTASLLSASLLVLGPGAPAQAAQVRAAPAEDYGSYQPGTECRPRPKPGAVALGRWMVSTFGGGFGGVGRACSANTSEHEEGRAFDWTLDAGQRADRVRARDFLTRVFATDRAGNAHARARRMGIMYVIWDDQMWASYDRFEVEPYLPRSCPSPRECSKAQRHRDHVHVSLTRAGGRGATSWYAGRLG